MQVRRLPHVGVKTGVDQRGEVALWSLDAGAAIGVVTELVAPARRRTKLEEQLVRWLGEVVRHLEREDTPWCQRTCEVRDQVDVAGHPVQRRVRDEDVDRPIRLPTGNVTDDELEPPADRMLLSRVDHVGRAVDTEHCRTWPAIRE